jgi:hypothetical protein
VSEGYCARLNFHEDEVLFFGPFNELLELQNVLALYHLAHGESLLECNKHRLHHFVATCGQLAAEGEQLQELLEWADRNDFNEMPRIELGEWEITKT